MRRARKATVLHGLHERLLERLWQLDDAWRDALGQELTIYSGRDSKHGRGSLHYVGCAVDIRTWKDPRNHRSGQLAGAQRKRLLRLVRQTMGKGFDVIDEGSHFHVEYQPKTPAEM